MNIENQLIPATTGIRTYPDGRMDVRAAAAYTRFSEKTLATWRLKGTGPEFIRVGNKRVFYRKEALDSFIAAGQGAAPKKMAKRVRGAE